MKQLLIMHGPNMNLLGLQSASVGTRYTLDKINRALRKSVRDSNFSLKIYQTHDEAKSVTLLHRNRKSAAGILITPGPWFENGYMLKETLELLKIPYLTVSFIKRENTIFRHEEIVVESDPMKAYLQALDSLIAQLK